MCNKIRCLHSILIMMVPCTAMEDDMDMDVDMDVDDGASKLEPADEVCFVTS